MCNIIYLRPGQAILDEHLQNVCYNNWHSFGLIIKGVNRFEVIRQVPQAETDWKEIKELLEENVDFERYLHVRHNTAGSNSLENCHPFQVFKSDDNEVYLMHNGTISEFKPGKWEPLANGQRWVEDNDGPSDTLNFANIIIKPLMEVSKFSTREGLNDFILKRLVNKFLTSGNRVLLVNREAGHSPIFCGDWTTFKSGEEDLYCSNDTYFKDVIRGPENDRRRLRREQEEAAFKAREETEKANLPAIRYAPRPLVWDEPEGTKTTTKVTKIGVTPLSELKPNFITFKALAHRWPQLLNDTNMWVREGAVAFGHLTEAELRPIFEDKENFYLFAFLLNDYAQLFEEYTELVSECDGKVEDMQEEIDKLTAKHQGATKAIATVAKENAMLKEQVMKLQNALNVVEQGMAA